MDSIFSHSSCSLCFLSHMRPCASTYTHTHTHMVYGKLKRCQQNSVLRKFLDKLTTQLHYMTCHKMDEENWLVLCSVSKVQFIWGFNGCLIKTSRPWSEFQHMSQWPVIDDTLCCFSCTFAGEFKQEGMSWGPALWWSCGCTAWEHSLSTFS